MRSPNRGVAVARLLPDGATTQVTILATKRPLYKDQGSKSIVFVNSLGYIAKYNLLLLWRYYEK